MYVAILIGCKYIIYTYIIRVINALSDIKCTKTTYKNYR